MQLRYYQQEAVAAALDSIRRGHNPALQLATGTGKSLIIAELALLASPARVWVLSHAQQLIGQNAEKFYRHTRTQGGIVCSGLGRADYGERVTFATIQSIINPGLRGELPEPELIIVDEAHRIPHKTGEQGQYERLLRRYPAARRIALTATPWRTDNGLIYGADHERFWFDELAYRYTVPQAVTDGYLSPLVGVETEVQLNLDGVAVNDDYVMEQVGQRQDNDWLQQVATSAVRLTAKRRHVAVYCPTITAAERAAAALARATGHKAAVLTGGMSRDMRRETLERFQAAEFKFLCSVDTMTTGWDFPALDCILCLRPTTASNLWVQIQGRGTRLHPEKKNCLLLDYVGNLQRLGGVDMLETYVREGEPLEPVQAAPQQLREARRTLPGVRTLAVIDPMTGQQAADGAELMVDVHAVNVVAIPTRRNPAQPVLLVQYACTTEEGARIDASAFINTEQPDAVTRRFFSDRRLAVTLPEEARRLVWQVKGAERPCALRVRKAGRYWNMLQELWND